MNHEPLVEVYSDMQCNAMHEQEASARLPASREKSTSLVLLGLGRSVYCNFSTNNKINCGKLLLLS